MKFKMGELFCGPGGLAFGAKQAVFVHGEETYNVEPIWANDNDADSCQTYASNVLMNAEAVVKSDQFDAAEYAALEASRRATSVICCDVRNLCLSNLHKINALAFGFPCNDFSAAGERLGLKGTFGPLYAQGVRVLEYHKPDWFIAENVNGITNHKHSKAFSKIVSELQNAGAGYRLTVHRYHFEQYGVPQARQRIIIVGIRRDIGLTFRVPMPTLLDPREYITAQQALANIPVNAANHEICRLAPRVQARLDSLLPGENAWNDRVPEEHRLQVKGAHLSQIYRILEPDKPAYTVTANGGGGTHGYHWDLPRRALTNRERARLQTFPDEFVFHGKKESVRRQVGMAVPPLAAKIIIEAVLKTFAGVEYPFVEAAWEVTRGREVTHVVERKTRPQFRGQHLLPMDVETVPQTHSVALQGSLSPAPLPLPSASANAVLPL